ncbi:hypothetical protein [Tahibacter amnicola]|uniref:Uncharacterized protein n=1 Tax=Tahibacter amnicola TaxID=2976241 RepID=A0ABY6B8Z8_9GAMM|nr:hypothetical protein [Tahibacter amnicola]UXI66499.1 hypothetical protein N4264_17315 [Tahibacter amnicola]
MKILILRSLLTALPVLSPMANAQTVYTDSFDSIGGWPDSDATGDLSAVYTVVGGEYLINPLQDRHYALATAPARTDSTNQVVEADVRLAASHSDSRAGVACRVGRGLTFYAFNLVKSGGVEIVRVVDGDASLLATGHLGVDPSEGVKLRGECRGSSLVLSVNGRELARTTDGSLGDGTGAGLLSVSPVIAATNAAFDNFRLSDGGGSSGAISHSSSAPPPRSSGRQLDGGSGSGDGYSGGMPVVDDMALYNDAFGKPGSRQSLFDAGNRRVYIVMELGNRARAQFRAEWRRIAGTDESYIMDSKMDNAAGHSRVWMYADRSWQPGLYRVDVYADGRLLDQREFSVTD